MIYRKWRNHLTLPVEELGDHDLFEIQSQELEEQAVRRKTLEARFSSTSELPRPSNLDTPSGSPPHPDAIESPQSAISLSATLEGLKIDVSDKTLNGDTVKGDFV